jgi:hypothetical protein
MTHNIIERIPWPANGIHSYTCIEDGLWGWLIQYADGGVEFDESSRPTDREILDQWGDRFNKAYAS